MRLVWIAAAVGVVCLHAQELGRVEGRVVTPTGEPVHKATVRLQGSPPVSRDGFTIFPAYVETTGPDGAFAFADLPTASYNVDAWKPGFTPAGLREKVPLAPGQIVREVTVQLTPLAVISGKVTDGEGDPVPFAQLSVLHYAWDGPGRVVRPVAEMRADDRGEFRVASLKAGRYYLRAEDQQVQMRIPAASLARPYAANAATYYPSEPSLGSAKAIDVKAGDEANGLVLRLLRSQDWVNRTDQFDRVMLVINGRVVVEGGDYAALQASSKAANGGVSIPVSDMSFNRQEAIRGPSVTLQTTGQARFEKRSAAVAGDGSFTLDRVTAGVHVLSFPLLPPGTYIKAVRVGDTDVTSLPLDLTRGVAGPMEIVLAPGAAEITVLPDGGARDAQSERHVVLWPKEPPRVLYDAGIRQLWSAMEQNPPFTNLTPGDYYVASFEHEDAAALRSIDF